MTSLRLPQPKTKARFLMIGYGLLLMVWMSLEDSSSLSVALLGTGATLLYSGAWLSGRLSQRDLPLRVWFSGIILYGTFIGMMSVLSTVFLMLFKSSWHGHFYPDYPPAMIGAMFTRLPLWTLSGTFFGVFCAIFILLRKTQTQDTL